MKSWRVNPYQTPMQQKTFQNLDYNTQTQFNPFASTGNTQQTILPSQNMIQTEKQPNQQTITNQQTQPTITFPNENN